MGRMAVLVGVICLANFYSVNELDSWTMDIDALPACGSSDSEAETIPEAWFPAASVPAASVPEDSVPAAPVPLPSVPAASVPADSVPAESVPAASFPCASDPAASVPGASIPAASAMQEAMNALPQPWTASRPRTASAPDRVSTEIRWPRRPGCTMMDLEKSERCKHRAEGLPTLELPFCAIW